MNDKLVVNASLTTVQSDDNKLFNSPDFFSSKNDIDLFKIFGNNSSLISNTTLSLIFSNTNALKNPNT